MSAAINKYVQISSDRARKLEQLALERGATENMLVEESLDLLFREQARRVSVERLLDEDRDELQRLEAELGPIPTAPRRAFPINPDEIVSIAGTPLDPIRLRRPGNDY